jgi:hypothetical protein
MKFVEMGENYINNEGVLVRAVAQAKVAYDGDQMIMFAPVLVGGFAGDLLLLPLDEFNKTFKKA